VGSQQTPVAALAPAVVRRRVASALRTCGTPLSRDEAGRIEPAGAAFVAEIPGWLAAVGALSAEGVHWIWCEPRLDAEAKTAVLSQIVVNAPPGRYVVEALDPSRKRWISRESATGGPLVCGLPFVAGPFLLRLRYVGPAQIPESKDA